MNGTWKQPDNIGPLFLTLFLVIWTACVYRFSHPGDNWALLPALLIFPSAVIWHCVLIAHKNPKSGFVVYAIIHLVVLVLIWVKCLMLISKNSI
jgi:hypothetical protein